MAGLGGKNWTFQEEVTSSDVNGYLADQVVMRFADSTARTAGFGGSGEPTLAEGMMSYLDDANRVDYYDGSAWKPVSQILQVVSTTKTDTFVSGSIAQGSDSAITGLSATITPSSTSSKILVHTSVNGVGGGGISNRLLFGISLYRGATKIGIGDAAGNRTRITAFAGDEAITPGLVNIAMLHLDSPATTSATTYQVYVANALTVAASATFYVNRTVADTDNSANPRVASSITLIEVA